DHMNELRRLMSVLPKVDFSLSVSTMLSDLYTTAGRIDCEDVNGAAVIELAEAVIRNPRYMDNGVYLRRHHQLMARVLRDDGEFERAIFHLRKAVEYGRGSDLNMMIVTTYADARKYE